MNTMTLSLTNGELETLVRRVVREELASILGAPARSILDDWRHEGPDDPAQDELLLRDALAMLRKYGDMPEALMGLSAFKQELARAEAAGELPD